MVKLMLAVLVTLTAQTKFVARVKRASWKLEADRVKRACRKTGIGREKPAGSKTGTDRVERAGWKTGVDPVERADRKTGVDRVKRAGRRMFVARMKDALWGDVHPKSQRWRDFLSELRDTVPDGVIGAVVDDVIPTSPELGSDLDLLEAFITRAATHPEERLACLQGAVDLLHGMPFAVTDPKAGKYWRWLDVEYTNGRLWLQLTQAACDLAYEYLAASDPAAAATVADKVLGAARLDPGLTEVLMLAYGALGVPEAAERVFEAHEAALLDEVGWEGAGDTTRRVIERIRGDRRNGDGQAQPLTLVRSPP